MTDAPLSASNVVSRQAWIDARKAHLAREKALTRELDALRVERRKLPWVRIEKPYLFDGPDGPCSLSDLFQGRNQLAVYHFMLAPGSDHICPGCSFIADHVDAARRHFEQADLSFCAISRAPLERIEQVRRRLGWTFPWVSSNGTDFNYDFGVSFRKEDIEAGRAIYNYDTVIRKSEDMHGTSIFAKSESGELFHTYSTFFRGDEPMIGAFSWLDLTPKGRNEDGTMSWVRLHDEYGAADQG
ncbi:MAG: thioredoxin family protein [Alphaproteobacteria bacterium]